MGKKPSQSYFSPAITPKATWKDVVRHCMIYDFDHTNGHIMGVFRFKIKAR
jgi:hypothetical protein